MRVLRWLYFGHVHKWVEDSRHDLVGYDKSVIGVVVICHCEKCGEPRRFTLK